MEKWYVAAKKADFQKIADEFGISPVLARIIRNRDVESLEEIRSFLYGSKADLYDPMALKDMDIAVTLLKNAIAEKKKIRIIGDYDVDGICASHILLTGLTEAGAKADVAIPHRMKDGYGLNEHLVQEAYEAGTQLLVTCDNGIAAAQQIALAKELGMEVLITDHHEVPFTEENGEKKELLPDADGVIDPKQASCSYPFPGICGAVVALKVIQALFQNVCPEREQEIFDKLLPFASLATICDVMELKSENRIIVKEGLKRMKIAPPIGLLALMRVNGLEPSRLSSYHLGFVIGPCMNAAGRLDTASRVLSLLSCKDAAEAVRLAEELKELNDSRKAMTVQGVERARTLIEQEEMQKDKVLVVYLTDCHESLAGIIAGRLREFYNKPAFVLTDSEEELKGSGRSIDAYNMYEEMVRCRECFTKFGGHKMAAGFSLKKENLELLRKRLNDCCTLQEEDYVKKVHIDVPMPLSYANLELASQLELLEPFGTGNPKPLFAQKEVVFLRGQRMGAEGNFARFTVLDDAQKRREMVYFGNLEKFHDFLNNKFGDGAVDLLYRGEGQFLISVTYQLGINAFRGIESAQLILQDYM